MVTRIVAVTAIGIAAVTVIRITVVAAIMIATTTVIRIAAVTAIGIAVVAAIQPPAILAINTATREIAAPITAANQIQRAPSALQPRKFSQPAQSPRQH